MNKMHQICTIDGCSKPRFNRGLCVAHFTRWKRHGDPLGGRTPVGEARKWVQEVALAHQGDECLTWPFNKGDGHGQIKIDGKNMPANRYVCTLAHGEPPTPGHEAAHSCGKGHLGCVNKGHLSWKTRAENFADKLIHGTHNRGERNHCSKLTEPEVREILALRGEVPQSQIAEKFGVAFQTISKIHNGERWGWLR